jgi:predicted regulator of Ras-like GTPase activity (Roadblock/LC7/MglB family)
LTHSAVAAKTEVALEPKVAPISIDTEDSSFASLGASLAEIRKLKGVVGYIMRGNSSAMLDIPDRERVSPCALLSYQLHESCLDIAKQLSMAEIESVLVEGGDMKVLFIKIGENKISVFMEKGANHMWIIKRILL